MPNFFVLFVVRNSPKKLFVDIDEACRLSHSGGQSPCTWSVVL
jgi:hypothetical protein